MLQLIDSNTFTSSSDKVSFPIPVGNYRRLAVNFKSTLSAGEGANLVASDFGHLVIRENFTPTRIRADILDFYNRKNTGNTQVQKDVDTDSLVTWFFEHVISLPYDTETILPVQDENSMFLEFEFSSTMATRLGSNTGTAELYAEFGQGIAPYRVRFNSQDLSIVNGSKSFPLGVENIETILFEYNTNISKLRYRKDGSLSANSGLDAYIESTLRNNQIEDYNPDAIATTLPFLEIWNNPRQVIVDVLNDENIIEVDGSGADTITVGILSVDFTPIALQTSQTTLARHVNTLLQRKNEKGRTRPLEVVNALQG